MVLFLGFTRLKDGACKPLYCFRVIGLLRLLQPQVHVDDGRVLFMCSFAFCAPLGAPTVSRKVHTIHNSPIRY